MSQLIDVHEEELLAGPPPEAVTFDQVAADWLHHVEHVDGIKPSTLKSYRYMLRAPGDSPRKRGRRKAGGRVMREFGGQPIARITTAQVERWLSRLDEQPISKRTINIHRQLVCSVLEHAVPRPDQYGIQTNVARATSKRCEPDPVVLDFYEPEEVAALARAARASEHRDPSRPAISDAEREERRRADDQDAALFIVAAFTGLRMGELLELRWRYVSSSARPSSSPPPGAAARSPRRSRASRARCRSPRRPPPSSLASPIDAGSPPPTTSCSAARSETISTPRRCAADYAEHRMPPDSGRSASTTCADSTEPSPRSPPCPRTSGHPPSHIADPGTGHSDGCGQRRPTGGVGGGSRLAT